MSIMCLNEYKKNVEKWWDYVNEGWVWTNNPSKFGLWRMEDEQDNSVEKELKEKIEEEAESQI
jgi:hypothetical protein